jgi:hypothetical protein
MITVLKEPLKGTPDDIQAKLEQLAAGQDHREYLAGTRLRELALKLALHNGLDVSVAVYEGASQELEVTLRTAPCLGPILINRSDPGGDCQITLDRWLPIDTQPGIESVVNLIDAILKASVTKIMVTEKYSDSDAEA